MTERLNTQHYRDLWLAGCTLEDISEDPEAVRYYNQGEKSRAVATFDLLNSMLWLNCSIQGIHTRNPCDETRKRINDRKNN